MEGILKDLDPVGTWHTLSKVVTKVALKWVDVVSLLLANIFAWHWLNEALPKPSKLPI